MEPRSFRTSTERLIRVGVLMLLVDTFALLFLWDGHIGYERANARQLAELVGLPPSESPPVNSRVTQAAAMRMVDEAVTEQTLRGIVSAFGEPSLEHGGISYYLGQGGWLAVTRDGSGVAACEWTDGQHTEADQAWQRYIGYALSLLSLWITYALIKTAAARITLSEGGVRVFGRETIAWNAIREVQLDAHGSIRVEVADGEPIAIDDYLYRDAGEIVRAICERTGSANPLERP